ASSEATVSHIKRSRTDAVQASCDNFLYEELQGHALRAGQVARPWYGSKHGHASPDMREKRGTSGRAAAGAGVKGHSPLPGDSLARCLKRSSAPARAAAATRSAAHPLAGGPRRHAPPGGRACKSQPGGPPAPGRLTPRQDHNQGRTSSLPCGRSTLILIFHGKNRHLSGGRRIVGTPGSTMRLIWGPSVQARSTTTGPLTSSTSSRVSPPTGAASVSNGSSSGSRTVPTCWDGSSSPTRLSRRRW